MSRYACPKCKGTDIRIRAEVSVRPLAEGCEVTGDIEWDSENLAYCQKDGCDFMAANKLFDSDADETIQEGDKVRRLEPSTYLLPAGTEGVVALVHGMKDDPQEMDFEVHWNNGLTDDGYEFTDIGVLLERV